MIAILALTMMAATPDAEAPIRCAGEHRQGAILVCRTAPGAQVTLGDLTEQADAEGWIVMGHHRDAPAEAAFRVRHEGGVWETRIDVEAREYEIQRIDGLPPAMVTPPPDPEFQARLARENRAKGAAYTSRWEGRGFLDGFDWPVTGRITGVYGSQRVLNGEPRRPHFGLDIAAPTGTPVVSPAGGVVTLADPDMYWEGGLIFIDHGQGFTGVFMHLDSIDVAVGDVVERGQLIGTVGATGRVTGPHLDWRVRWRNRQIDPEALLALDLSDLR